MTTSQRCRKFAGINFLFSGNFVALNNNALEAPGKNTPLPPLLSIRLSTLTASTSHKLTHTAVTDPFNLTGLGSIVNTEFAHLEQRRPSQPVISLRPLLGPTLPSTFCTMLESYGAEDAPTIGRQATESAPPKTSAATERLHHADREGLAADAGAFTRRTRPMQGFASGQVCDVVQRGEPVRPRL